MRLPRQVSAISLPPLSTLFSTVELAHYHFSFCFALFLFLRFPENRDIPKTHTKVRGRDNHFGTGNMPDFKGFGLCSQNIHFGCKKGLLALAQS
jgi:hypothetical protein